MDPPVGSAPTSSALQGRRISVSATEESEGDVTSPLRNGASTRICTSNLSLRTAVCRTLTPWKLANWCDMPVLPRRALFGRQTDMLLLHQCRKMVAASGIAPDSPRLQQGANLSQLHRRVGPSARTAWRVSASEYAKRIWQVALSGNPPRSSAYRAGALLLSYGGIE